MTIWDVFISYSSANLAWVRTLAENLKRHGFKVWLDQWELKPGQDFAFVLDAALQNAAAGILVVTPEATASGWVQQEYSRMLQRRNSPGRPFTILPVLLGEGAQLPFLNTIQHADFRDPQRYETAFQQLLDGLRLAVPEHVTAGANGQAQQAGVVSPDAPPAAPALRQRARDFIGELLTALDTAGICVLLAQDGQDQTQVQGELLAQARERFGEAVIRIHLPADTPAEVMARFGSDPGGGSVSPAVIAADELRSRLAGEVAQRRSLLVLVDHFENGPKALRQSVSGTLRGLHDLYGDRLRVVIRGGRGLSELKFVNPDTSLLNIAKPFYWPDLDPDDLVAVHGRRFPKDPPLDPTEAASIHGLCGGQPRLIDFCLDLRHEQGGTVPEQDYLAELREGAAMWELFLPFLHQPDAAERLGDLLAKDDFGPERPYHPDALVRALFWRNLLAHRRREKRKRLVWRCPVLQEAGREILSCA